MKSFDCLNSECHIVIENKIKEIFYANFMDEGWNSDELDFALEIFRDNLIEPHFLGRLDCGVLFAKYSQEELQHPAFKELMSMSFFPERDLEFWGIILSNHVKAIDMITSGNIPLYNGPLLDVTNLDVLLNSEGIN